MKILLLTTHLDFGGISVYCTSLAEILKRMGHEVKVASSGGVLAEELKKHGIEHIHIDIRTKSEFSPLLRSSRRRLTELFKTDRPDIIHAQTRVTQVLACMLSKKTNIPYVSTCHGFFRPHLGRKLFGFWGQKVIAISEAVREHLVNDLGVKKEIITLVHNGIKADRFKKDIPEPQRQAYKSRLGLKEGPVVGIIARLSPVKGHKFLLMAVSEAAKKIPEIQLLIVGEGPTKSEIIDMAIGLGLGSRVYIEEPTLDTSKAFSVMHVFVLPSLQEGLGLAVMEAMSAGLPVIGTNVGGVYSLIKDNQTGLLVPPQDSGALAEAICKLLTDKKLAASLAASAKKLIEEDFSLELMARKIEAAYKEVLSNQKPETEKREKIRL